MKIANTNKLDNIFTILLNTIPRLYYDFNLSYKCMKSNNKLAKQKQKKQARVKIDGEFVRMPMMIRGRIIEI